ncbi:MAG: N-acetylglucosamine-6-phosphate deacetylase [Hungatella sp.]|nr:N-acetylglucosamine-6-phosphate deacetylase [Hungatella sp.]
MKHLFYNGKILGQEQLIDRGYVLVDKGVIVEMGEGECTVSPAPDMALTDLKGLYLSPGFIDSHTHGGGGCDYMDGTTEAVVTAARLHLAHGTTTICPTSMASFDEELWAFLDAFQQAKSIKDHMPHLHGIHLEGPYFSPEQAGAQPPQCMTKPFPHHFFSVVERARGSIVRWSSAPEVEGVIPMGDECIRLGILPSMAHTNADYPLIRRAMEHGYHHLTHFYSGMSSLHRVKGYRILGAVEAGYLEDDLYIELIADGIHLPPELLKMILKCKDHDHISLVTDSMRAAGMAEGPSVLGSLKNNYKVIVEDGIAKVPDRQCFAGSVATADRLVRVMNQEAGLSIWEAVKMISQNPAKLLKIFDQTGSIAVGKAADLLIFDENIGIQEVYVDGEQMG